MLGEKVILCYAIYYTKNNLHSTFWPHTAFATHMVVSISSINSLKSRMTQFCNPKSDFVRNGPNLHITSKNFRLQNIKHI